MCANDRGATLLEVVMAIVLLGLLFPTVYTLITSIHRGMQVSYNKEQVYQIVQRAVETTKIKGDADIDDSIGPLPAGYSVFVYDKGYVDSADHLKHYQVMVFYDGQETFTYNFYWETTL